MSPTRPPTSGFELQDLDPAPAAKTLAHELGHISACPPPPATTTTTAAESPKSRPSPSPTSSPPPPGWTPPYTVPYVANWSGGDPDVVRAAAVTVTTAARRILDHLDAAESAGDPAGTGRPPPGLPDRSGRPSAPASSPRPERGARHDRHRHPRRQHPHREHRHPAEHRRRTRHDHDHDSHRRAHRPGEHARPAFRDRQRSRCGIEQRETEHVDGAATDSAAAGTTEDGGRAHRLVWLDPRGLAVHPRNIRDDLEDLSGLADSIAAQGVLEALTVIPHVAADGTPGHQLVAGHRRAAAAILAGLTAVPCVLRPDLALDGAAADGDRAAQAAAVAVYAGDPDTTAALIAAAGEGPGGSPTR